MTEQGQLTIHSPPASPPVLRLYSPEVPPLSGPWALCTLFPLSGKHPSPLPSGQFSFIFLCLGLTCCFWNSPVSEPSRVGPTYVPASACPQCFLSPGTQEALSKCSAKGSRTLALLLDWSSTLSSTRANHPARQTVFTNHFCVCSGHRSSPTMANKTQQVSAVEARRPT